VNPPSKAWIQEYISMESPLKVTIKKWTAVAEWSWIVSDEDCGICRCPFNGCPPKIKFPGDDCPPAWGQCGHAFHWQCISEWIDPAKGNNNTCPMCRKEWEFK